MKNINWANKPEWAIGTGYSANHNLWLWFDHSHYQMPFGDARFPFNSSFSKNDMTDIQLAYANQLHQKAQEKPCDLECGAYGAYCKCKAEKAQVTK